MKIICALLLLISYALALTEVEYQAKFTDWMQLYSRSYDHDVFQAKYQTWKANMAFIEDFNSKGTNSFTVAMNGYGDLSVSEFNQRFKGLKMPAELPPAATQPIPFVGQATVDWRTKGAVTAVKNQGQCGSCWSFSTTGSVEGCHKITTNTLVSLSEQNLMDCSWAEGNEACDGGLMTQAMEYIIKNKGIDTETSYPYTATSSQSCKYKTADIGSTETSYTNVASGSETDLANKVNLGPTSVAIDASHSSFQFYKSGVYYEPACSATQLDHGVLAVGYGTDGTSDYWLVKNSWGTDWGMSGYINMARNRNNNCGIATMATLPTSCH
jgi:cathepsin L